MAESEVEPTKNSVAEDGVEPIENSEKSEVGETKRFKTDSKGEQAHTKISSMVRLKSEPESANDIQAVRQAIDKAFESYDF